MTTIYNNGAESWFLKHGRLTVEIPAGGSADIENWLSISEIMGSRQLQDDLQNAGLGLELGIDSGRYDGTDAATIVRNGVSITHLKAAKSDKSSRSVSRLVIEGQDGFCDDYDNEDGIDEAVSSNYTVESSFGFVRVADGQSEAVVITPRVSTVRPQNYVRVSRYMFHGTGTFHLSQDDGDTWAEITAFDDWVAISGTDTKKYRMKVELSGNEKLGFLSFDLKP